MSDELEVHGAEDLLSFRRILLEFAELDHKELALAVGFFFQAKGRLELVETLLAQAQGREENPYVRRCPKVSNLTNRRTTSAQTQLKQQSGVNRL